jgi:hypothetical protein
MAEMLLAIADRAGLRRLRWILRVSARRAAAKVPIATVKDRPNRRISEEAGRAIEVLGHAIEYLSDEFALECMTRRDPGAVGVHPRVAAIEILIDCNRAVYFDCPEERSFGDWLRSLLGLRIA